MKHVIGKTYIRIKIMTCNKHFEAQHFHRKRCIGSKCFCYIFLFISLVLFDSKIVIWPVQCPIKIEFFITLMQFLNAISVAKLIDCVFLQSFLFFRRLIEGTLGSKLKN